jgi:hypothetical protein
MLAKRYSLTVKVPDMRVFYAYWYGYGTVESVTATDGGHLVTVDYDVDGLRAECQADRFASGLYFATVLES